MKERKKGRWNSCLRFRAGDDTFDGINCRHSCFVRFDSSLFAVFPDALEEVSR